MEKTGLEELYWALEGLSKCNPAPLLKILLFPQNPSPYLPPFSLLHKLLFNLPHHIHSIHASLAHSGREIFHLQGKLKGGSEGMVAKGLD